MTVSAAKYKLGIALPGAHAAECLHQDRQRMLSF
jgi:hypothetical protein